uniref:Uncharacterized protein n=1 Tax=Glossina austeni TaxID=7395 RepID=A0A1A9UF84_GLOAU
MNNRSPVSQTTRVKINPRRDSLTKLLGRLGFQEISGEGGGGDDRKVRLDLALNNNRVCTHCYNTDGDCKPRAVGFVDTNEVVADADDIVVAATAKGVLAVSNDSNGFNGLLLLTLLSSNDLNMIMFLCWNGSSASSILLEEDSVNSLSLCNEALMRSGLRGGGSGGSEAAIVGPQSHKQELYSIESFHFVFLMFSTRSVMKRYTTKNKRNHFISTTTHFEFNQ